VYKKCRFRCHLKQVQHPRCPGGGEDAMGHVQIRLLLEFSLTILEWYVLFWTCSLFKCAYQMLFLMKTILNYFKLKERQK